MRRLPLLLPLLALLACASHDYSGRDGTLRLEIRGKHTHEICDNPYEATFLFTGKIPDEPVCIEVSYEDNPIQTSCGMLIKRWMFVRLNVPKRLYKVMAGIPTRDWGWDETHLGGTRPGWGDEENVVLHIRIRVLTAEPHPETGQLVPLPFVHCLAKKRLRLSCRDCEFVS